MAEVVPVSARPWQETQCCSQRLLPGDALLLNLYTIACYGATFGSVVIIK